jgi:ribonuclease Z
MPTLTFLGSAYAVADLKHENTHMTLTGRERVILIDCVNNPLLRFERIGLDFHHLTDVIVTHFHPDHISGVPTLLMNMWLMGRKAPINLYGLHHTLDRIENLMSFYDWAHWPNFYPVAFHRLPQDEQTLVLESREFRVLSSPVNHMLPTIGLRVEMLETGKSLAYSCDTEPCEQVIRLGSQVDWLIHEASGAGHGHSSAAQAGEVARAAGARHLYLVHYPVGNWAVPSLVDDARYTFGGPVTLAEDFLTLDV